MSRSSVLRILPLAVSGKESALNQRAGALNLAIRPAQKRPSASGVSVSPPSTAAATISP